MSVKTTKIGKNSYYINVENTETKDRRKKLLDRYDRLRNLTVQFGAFMDAAQQKKIAAEAIQIVDELEA